MIKSFPERLSELEGKIKELESENQDLVKTQESQIDVINKLAQQVRQAFSVERDTMDATVTALKSLNPEFQVAFAKALDGIKAAHQAKKAEQEKAQLNQLVETGQIAPSTSVSDKTILMVGALKNSKTDEVINPRVVVQLQALPPALVQEFLGKEVGFEHFSKESDEKYVLAELYDEPSKKEVPMAPPEVESKEETQPTA